MTRKSAYTYILLLIVVPVILAIYCVHVILVTGFCLAAGYPVGGEL